MKTLFSAGLLKGIRIIKAFIQRKSSFTERLCPICEFKGHFLRSGHPPRIDAICPKCGSMERHRLFWLWHKEVPQAISPPILHFAAERPLLKKFKDNLDLSKYKTADIAGTPDVILNIESIDLDDSSTRTIICNHVLEHVDDKKALQELHRILTTDGTLILSIPIIEGWDKTYENPKIHSPEGRALHFGQDDHLRYYGRDFRNRLSSAGFVFEEVTAEGPNVITYSLLRGEKIFICRKSKEIHSA